MKHQRHQQDKNMSYSSSQPFFQNQQGEYLPSLLCVWCDSEEQIKAITTTTTRMQTVEIHSETEKNGYFNCGLWSSWENAKHFRLTICLAQITLSAPEFTHAFSTLIQFRSYFYSSFSLFYLFYDFSGDGSSYCKYAKS